MERIKMGKKLKEFYEAPTTLVVEVEQNGVLCGSPMVPMVMDGAPLFTGFDDEVEW